MFANVRNVSKVFLLCVWLGVSSISVVLSMMKVKRRKMLAEQHRKEEEERKRKLREEQDKLAVEQRNRQEMEKADKQLVETRMLARHVRRRIPLGTDRNHSR